ncbi:MAG: NUDIX domain-containing protein [Salibacteraceae bacterium]
MKQKYKFFIRQKAIIITSDADFTSKWWLSEKDQSSEKIMEHILEEFETQTLETNRAVWVHDANQLLTNLLKQCAVVTAGGGYVLNNEGQLLMIHRRGFWDLPKGKLEPNETIEACAIREVEEECGVSHLSIVSDAFVTYHLYHENARPILKKSVWYGMKTDFNGGLQPQIEEDIELVEWVSVPVPKSILKEAYPSIIEVINHFSMA